MKEISYALGAITIILVLVFGAQYANRVFVNRFDYTMHKVDDRTRYETIKRVEDEARTMVASYNTDKMRYEDYKTSDNAEHRSWGEQAKMRANQTAATYNEFILKNSFVFDGNIPKDIRNPLPILD